MGQLTVTMLGCGTSVGIPGLGRAGWGKCDPDEPRNRRQRCALLVQSETTNILIDAAPISAISCYPMINKITRF